MTAPPPKPRRREVHVDVSGFTDRQIQVRLGVVALGELGYGPRWQTDLAAALSAEARRPVRFAQVSHWLSGHRPVPEAMFDPLQRLALRVAADLRRRADRIEAMWAPDPPADHVEALANAVPRIDL